MAWLVSPGVDLSSSEASLDLARGLNAQWNARPGGLIYALEGHLGQGMQRIANVEGRYVTVDGDRLTLGERMLLAEPDDVTVPGQI